MQEKDMKKTVWIGLLIPLLLAGGCKKGEKTEAEMAAGEAPAAAAPAVEPDKVEVQHILISFQGAISNENVTRTQDEAEALAREILERAQAGEDFDALVKQYTDDRYPGIYRMVNHGNEADEAASEFPRGRLVKAFGDISFSLEVGEIGTTVYDPETSKYGWHIIKRLK
jgi:hypothetical protein